MRKAFVFGAVVGILGMAGVVCGQETPACSPCCRLQEPVPASVETVLEQLQKKVADLKSYQCTVDYLVTQPLLESRTRRKGMLYYAKFDERSYLRVDFRTLQQDEEKPQQYRQQFVFDGVWLRSLDYQAEMVEHRQMAEPNRPVDAFALASRHVPVFGFAGIEDLRKQFDVKLVQPGQPEPNPSHHLHLTVKPESLYKDDYTTIEFWVDKKRGLPAKVVAVGAETDIGDVYEIRLLECRVNEGLDKSVFDVEIPKNWSVEIIPLERKQQQQ